MCYSAQVVAAYDRYVREWGAHIDLEKFIELYGFRAEDPRVKIPKGLDFMLAPRSPQIRALVDEHNARLIRSSEQDLFAQAKRLADAERKLAVKETKTALNDRRVAGNKVKQLKRWIADAKRTAHDPEKDDRIWPDWYAPVLVSEAGGYVVRPMRYHLRPYWMPASSDRTRTGQVSGKYNARRDNLTRFWQPLFGKSHALMLADVFYENVDDGQGGNQVLRFEPRTGETMLVACLWSDWHDDSGKDRDLLSFAAITDEPEPEVAAAGHDRTIINIQPQSATAWLNPDADDLQRMQDLFDDRRHPFYEHRVAA